MSNEQVYQRKGITTIANLFSFCDFDRLYRAFILLCAPQLADQTTHRTSYEELC